MVKEREYEGIMGSKNKANQSMKLVNRGKRYPRGWHGLKNNYLRFLKITEWEIIEKKVRE